MITLDLKGRSKIYDSNLGVLMNAIDNGFESYLGEIFYTIPPYFMYITDITLASFTGTNNSPKSDRWHIPNRMRAWE